jgi:5-hydroxyisourate hydrolase
VTTLSTHVLDAAYGVPAAGVRITLWDPEDRQLTQATTDADGRVRFDLELGAGTHTLVFDTGAYFAAADRDTFHPQVTVAFAVDPALAHLHVPLLLSPYSYTTYRGS